MSPTHEFQTPPDGPRASYPVTGPWAVLARAGLIVAIIAIVAASLAPSHYVPRLLESYHLEHFAAFYVTGLVASAALPHARLRSIGIGLIVLALLLELSQLLTPRSYLNVYEDAIADVGGAMSALLPIAVDRFRRLFRPAT